MRVLHFEDSAYKARAIRDVLESCRVTDIDSVMYLDDGVELYKKSVEDGNPYDLIITDMWYKKAKGMHEDRSGDNLINLAKQEGWTTPIIVCSNQDYAYPEIFGSLYYSERSDWEMQLRKYIEQLKK